MIQLIILFSFFSIKNAADYCGSALQSLFGCRKDMFYRVLSNDRIDWRRILRHVNKKLAVNIAVRSDAKDTGHPTCMIVDDTDMPKTGRKGEMLGCVFSHVDNRGSILGHKGLFLCRTDGSTQMLIDFTLLGEEGRVTSRPQGLSQKDIAARFSKERDSGCTITLVAPPALFPSLHSETELRSEPAPKSSGWRTTCNSVHQVKTNYAQIQIAYTRNLHLNHTGVFLSNSSPQSST